MSLLFREGDKMAQLFEINDIVEVLSNCQSYGERGIVVDYFTVEHLLNNPIVRVKLDSGKTRIYNESSLKKCDEIEREAENMALTEDFRIANVRFVDGYNSNKIFSFALFDDEVTEGDYVVCDTHNGYFVGKIISIDTTENFKKNVTKEIVCKVDFSKFERRKETRAKRAELKKKLDNAVKENQDMFLYETLAKANPSVAELLEQYKALI